MAAMSDVLVPCFWQQHDCCLAKAPRVALQVSVGVWWAREWACSEQQQAQFCQRKQALTAPQSIFTQTMYTWLRRGDAVFQFHAAGLVNCSDASAADAEGVCTDVQENCVFGGNYCLAPQAGRRGVISITGREALHETLRSSCVNQVRSRTCAPLSIATCVLLVAGCVFASGCWGGLHKRVPACRAVMHPANKRVWPPARGIPHARVTAGSGVQCNLHWGVHASVERLTDGAALCVQALQQFDAPELIFNYTQAWEAECVPRSNLTNDCSLAAFRSEVLPLWQDSAGRGQDASQQVRG